MTPILSQEKSRYLKTLYLLRLGFSHLNRPNWIFTVGHIHSYKLEARTINPGTFLNETDQSIGNLVNATNYPKIFMCSCELFTDFRQKQKKTGFVMYISLK